MQSFKNKKVLIFGLGLNDGGFGMAEFFLKQGAVVTVTDGKTEEPLRKTVDKLKKYGDKVIYHLGGHIKEDFENNDIIVRNPAIKRDNEWLEIARNAGKEIYMEMALFHKLCPCPIIGVTGTRGKSTTSSLIYEFLKEKVGEKVFLGGNIGKSAIRELSNLKKDNLVVLEMSSFQLDGMGESKLSSNTAVVTNMYKDHLNWHTDMQDYIETKKNIFRYQNEDGLLIVNIDNNITKEFIKESSGKDITFSLIDPSADYYLKDMVVYEHGKELLKIESLILDGEHNLYNILGAISTVRQYGVKSENIQNVLKRFTGVPGRQELVREVQGVKFYNDTTATSVEAVLAMFNRFGKENKGNIIMISGGVDKGLEYEKVISSINEFCKAVVLFEGTASEKISEMLGAEKQLNVFKGFDDMVSAVMKAAEISKKRDMVILCPGAASFNMFANEFDRGDQFVEAVNNLK
jgi:UDP-N-acetylmuramoylalanine--D-glutamate ligase